MNISTETIAAICTPPGDGGVAMIRLSGSRAIEISNKIFSKDISLLESHKMTYGQFLDGDQKEVDRGLIVVMRAPNSYTGEDVVELFCHGGSLITKKVLDCVIKAGANPAAPGEFTQRAYLNKKMDLAQAEAVQSLICAQNEYALKMAADQLEGHLSKKITQMQKKLIDQAAILEAWVDFPEEGIEFSSLDEIKAHLGLILDEIKALIDSYDNGRILKEGFSICLLGKPNVGKSSLLNQLLKKERAIVTPIAGTTRDLIEETILIDGMQYHLIDTAGIRKVDEEIEKEGIARALKAAQKADLVLLVLDAGAPLTKEDQNLLEEVQNQKTLIVWNKIDLNSVEQKVFENQVEISAKTSQNIESLYQKISQMMVQKVHLKDQIYLTEVRHKDALKKAYEYLLKVTEGLDVEASPEWLSFDLKSALGSLSQIIGFDVTESILSSIFSKFCIGK